MACRYRFVPRDGAVRSERSFHLLAEDRPVGQAYSDRSDMSAVDLEELARHSVVSGTFERGLRSEAVAEKPQSDARRVSVVICTRDRPAELARCLRSLLHQTRIPDQIIVVDNASDDGGQTREAARAAEVIYVREDRPGLDIARNSGAAAASGDIVAYTDDDVRLHPRWLERIVAPFDDPMVMGVTGLVLPAELATPAQRHFETYWGLGAASHR